MKLFKIFLKDQKGSAEAIAFLVYTMLVMYILAQFVEIASIGMCNVFLTLAYKRGLDQMQIDGGLTATTEQNIKDYITGFGMDPNKLTIDGTIAHINWGQDVYLSLSYDKDYYKYSLLQIVDLSSSKKTLKITEDGSTTSYYYSNN